ncbi:MAG: hypothetical protein K6G71_09840 [Clostridiales bacterium]|nr:hypothetical protein [Clostridiales bacterium]
MRYRLFVYKTKAAMENAPAINDVNRAVSIDSVYEWGDSEAADDLEHFDYTCIKDQIKKELGEKCQVIVRYPPRGIEQKEFLYIATSYEKAREVLPRVHAIAMENSLALYDAETGKTFYKSLIDDAFITLRIRKKELRACILRDMGPVWNIRKISSYQDEWEKSFDYTVTLRKSIEKSFLTRVTEFYDCLKGNLSEDETLVCEDRTFTVSGERYCIRFVLEGYKDQADLIGYYENGHARQDIPRRMSVEAAYKWLSQCSSLEKSDVRRRMNFREMKDRYPNPADRIVASVRITKWQRQQVFDVRYSGIGFYGSEILFHVVPDEYFQDHDSISVLKIEETSASFILPFIEDVYPYFNERYYDKNYLPTQMWSKIIDRIKAAREMVVNDTYSPELAKYIESFDLFVFDKGNDPRLWNSNKEYDPVGFVFEHRFEIAYLYEIFIQWSETQIQCYGGSGDGRMFNIQGP